METTFTIKSVTARSAKVTNDQTGESIVALVTPYHRDGKQMAYVVIDKKIGSPIARKNIPDYTKPIDLKSISLHERSKNNNSFDFSEFKFEE